MSSSELLETLLQNAKRHSKANSKRRSRHDFLTLDKSTVPEWKAFSQVMLPDTSVRAAIDYYAETTLPRARPRSNASHIRNILYRFSDLLGKDASIRAISAAIVTQYQTEMINRGLANASINRYMDELYGFLKYCKDNQLLVEDISRLKSFPESRRNIYLSKAEERRLLAVSPIQLRQFLVFLLGTGARKSEAVNLQWEDVRFEKGGKRSWAIFTQTKNGRAHSVPLPVHITQMFREMKAAQPAGFKYVFSFIPKRDLSNSTGKLMQRQGVAKWYSYPYNDFYVARQRAGLPHIHLHACRHTYATRLLTAGVPLLTVSSLLNHTYIHSTLRYAHLSVAHLEKSIGILDQRTTSSMTRNSVNSAKTKSLAARRR